MKPPLVLRGRLRTRRHVVREPRAPARRLRWTWSGGADSVDLERLVRSTAVRPTSSLTAVGSLLMPAAGSPGLMASPSSITGSSPARSSGSKSSALARATKRAATLKFTCHARQPPVTSTSRRLTSGPYVRGPSTSVPVPVMAQEAILVQASPLRLAGEWARSCPAAAALPAAAGTGRVRRAPGAASSRASFEPERASTTKIKQQAGRARQAPRRVVSAVFIQ